MGRSLPGDHDHNALRGSGVACCDGRGDGWERSERVFSPPAHGFDDGGCGDEVRGHVCPSPACGPCHWGLSEGVGEPDASLLT
eukprot:CAMPEP_0181315098 /NCGR_PEP_ID=MMETSP1101-20121128/15183_1 /TAXON_ID=46948 /ORGANISM="Rhodomonas abbreviata, Strain Caron Lab Isolate" /LENGTH=82 /DNA_ID=CAMNT_0023422261 /DNA_START=605 /DNA_END=853 /DNA_ORIENTATION=+